MSETSHNVKQKLSEDLHIRAGVGERLRAERRRLGLNQADFGEIAGVSRRTQASYEAGTGIPDAAYLAALAVRGLDVLFVVTGARRGGGEDGLGEPAGPAFAPAAAPGPAEERALIESFRRMRAEDRRALQTLARSLGAAERE